MATTEHFYTGNSSTTTFGYTFPILQNSDLKVELDGVIKTENTSGTNNDYSISGTNVVLNSAPANNVDIHIYRVTNVDSAKAVFAAGSSIRAGDLNNNVDQSLYANQEQQQKIRTADVRDNAVTTIKIKDLNVTTAKIANDAIDGTKIADDQINSEHYVDGSIDTQHIADSQITSAKIADGTIVNADINASAAIAGTKIAPDFGSQNIATTGTVDGRDVSADGTKLDGIETGATADQTNAEIRTAVEAASDSNVFTDADHSKLDGIEASATADQTVSEIKNLIAGSPLDASHLAANSVGSSEIASNAVTDSEISTGTLDNRYYTETELNDGQLDNRYFTETELANGAVDGRYYTEAELNGGQLNNLYFTESEITGGAADGRYYTETELDAGQLDTRYFTETELANGALDGRYYTETEAEAKFLRQDSSETIASGDSWSNSDAHVATTAAINARIIDLIDEVGGFTAIDSDQHFPNTNPQGSTGQAAILSIQAASAQLPHPSDSNVSSLSGTTLTIKNANVANNADVIITGVTTTIPSGFGFLVESTSTLHTYSFHRLVPKATEVTTVASNITNIVNAGANVADINNFADIYIISASQPSTRNDGSALQEGDLWFDSSNDNLQVYTGSAFSIITPSQSVLNDVAIVSGAITYSEDLGLITNAASTGSSNGSLDIVADLIEDEVTFAITVSSGAYFVDGVSKPALTLYKGWTYTFDVSDASNASHPLRFSSGGSAYNTGVTVTGTQGQAGAKVQLVVPESQPTSFIYYCTNHSGMGNSITVKDDPIKTVSDNVTNIVAAASNATNINAVAADATDIGAVAAKATEIGRLGTADAVADMAILGTADVVADLNTLGTADIVSDMNALAVSGVISDMDTCATNVNSINTVGSAISNVNTVASNVSGINDFADRYRIASSAPSSNNDAGDLYFDTTSNELRVYNGSAWQGGVTATGNLAGLGSNTFSGNQTINANIIVSGTVDGVDIAAFKTSFDNLSTDIVNDTTPQLGGALDGQNNNMSNIGTIDGANLQLDFGTI